MMFRLWRPLLGLLIMGEHAASIRIPSARARVPGGALTATAGGAKKESVWIVGGPGQSCSAACDEFEGAESASCNEEMIKYLDTEAEVSHVAVDGNIPCDPAQGFGYSEFPHITTFNKRCSYRRPWTYPPSCHVSPVPASHRYCSCGGTWYRGALGDSCDATCAVVGGACEELPLEECITEECIRALGEQAGFPCSSALIYAKEFPSQLPDGRCAYTYGYQERCDETVDPSVQWFCACDTVGLLDGYGQGDPHIRNIYGEKFDINFVGNHSMIRIPGDGPREGETLELSARVADFGHLKLPDRCSPYYFYRFDLRGELLGGAVRHIEVSRHGAAGVRFSSVMAEGNQSLLDQSLTEPATLRGGAVFGNVTVRHHTRPAKGRVPGHIRHTLSLRIQVGPPIEVAVHWWTGKQQQPGLNLRVHGLSPGLGAIGGLLGLDPHGDVSSDPGIKGCPPRATADRRRQAMADTVANRKRGSMLFRGGLYPDGVVH